MQDAINNFKDVVNHFNELHGISVSSESVFIHYYDWVSKGNKTKPFTESVALLEWCEQNLTEKIT